MASLPRAAAGLPGCGGAFKASPEDFLVEEVPAYLPSGAGEHLYLWVEKRALSGPALLADLARALGLRPGEVGYAGLKDARAVTRQWLSVPARCAAGLARLPAGRFRVLAHRLHSNKLRCGHLRGNRFTVRLRGCHGDGLARARAIAAHLAAVGLPNAYGPQRFGRGGDNVAAGLALLAQAGRPPGRRHVRPQLRRLLYSAVQSALFNRALAARLEDGLVGTVVVGDVMQRRASGGLFVSAGPEADQARVDAGELVVTGPMFGPKMLTPTGPAAAREAALLAEAGLSLADFGPAGRLMQGSRRPLLVWPQDVHIAALASPSGQPVSVDLEVAFVLPPGSYATVFLRELMEI